MTEVELNSLRLAVRHRLYGGSEVRDGVLSRLLTKLNSLWVAAIYPFAEKGENLSLHYTSEISRSFAPLMRFGNRVEVGRQTWFFTWPTPEAGLEGSDEIKISISDNCRIAERCTITAGNSIHLESDVVLESDVLVMDHSHAYEDMSKPIRDQGTTPGGRIRIGQGCRIGRGAAILCSNKGELVLGRNCVVEPGTVVSRSFPANSLLSGNPARSNQKSRVLQTSAGTRSMEVEVKAAEQGA
jgi:acetyltransferase-like isoleucine patch superfamily enzyme